MLTQLGLNSLYACRKNPQEAGMYSAPAHRIELSNEIYL